jgi:hypothetical protein
MFEVGWLFMVLPIFVASTANAIQKLSRHTCDTHIRHQLTRAGGQVVRWRTRHNTFQGFLETKMSCRLITTRYLL